MMCFAGDLPGAQGVFEEARPVPRPLHRHPQPLRARAQEEQGRRREQRCLHPGGEEKKLRYTRQVTSHQNESGLRDFCDIITARKTYKLDLPRLENVVQS